MPNNPTEATVSILVEIPESLHEALLVHLEHSKYNEAQIWAMAIALYLMQNCEAAKGDNYRVAARTYLDKLFRQP